VYHQTLGEAGIREPIELSRNLSSRIPEGALAPGAQTILLDAGLALFFKYSK
jgi:hypothetical protein